MLPAPIELRADAHPRLTTIVLLRGDLILAEACLAALAASECVEVPSETILVVQPGDDLRRLVTGRVAGALVIWTGEDLGTAASWNLACGAARAPWVAIIHEDTVVRQGWQRPLIARLETDSRLAIVGPRLENPDGSLQNCGWVIARDGVTRQVDDTASASAAAGTGPLAVDLVSSACMVFDRRLWERLGGFDERFFPAVGVEIDFALAAWASGRVVRCERDVAVTHGGSAMVRSAHRTTDTELRHFLIGRNTELLAAKWREWLADHPPCAGDPGALRALAAARLERRRADADGPPAMPGRSIPAGRRDLTAGATVDSAGRIPPAVGTRASTARAELMAELVSVLAGQRDAARGDAARLSDHGRAVDVERIAALDAEAVVLRARSEALDMVLGGGWWRLRGMLLALPARGIRLVRRLLGQEH